MFLPIFGWIWLTGLLLEQMLLNKGYGGNNQKWVERNWKPKEVVYEKQRDDEWKKSIVMYGTSHMKVDPVPRMHPKDHQLGMFYGIKRSWNEAGV